MTIMRIGDKGADVRTLQSQLSANGYALVPDGHFGPATERAVREFQRYMGLVVDGIAGSKTLDALSGMRVDYLLQDKDLYRAAEALGVEVAVIRAVNAVESRGDGFFAAGQPAILYERHIMRRRLLAAGISVEGLPPSLVNTATGGYIGGLREYDRLASAIKIDRDCAHESCSWGAFQIMGFHWKALGYSSIDEFVSLMKRSEGDHLDAFVRFIQVNWTLQAALQEKDWTAFARGYNGPAYWKHGYHHRMAAEYERISEEDRTGMAA